MGYWNGWSNYEEWFGRTYSKGKICLHCGEEFWPKTGNQKYCRREDNPECCDDRYFAKLWEKGKHPLQNIDNQLIRDNN